MVSALIYQLSANSYRLRYSRVYWWGFDFLIHRKDANRIQDKVERGILVTNNNSINEEGFIHFVTTT